MPTRKELDKQQLWVPGSQFCRVLKDCDVCGRYSAGLRGKRVDGLTIKSTVPWGSVCMGAAGPMGITGKKGKKYLLVLMDSMSGYVIISQPELQLGVSGRDLSIHPPVCPSSSIYFSFHPAVRCIRSCVREAGDYYCIQPSLTLLPPVWTRGWMADLGAH
ncbi:hypothetical protein D5F01_LYC20712 [Larimichthys crocea]|uniref:Uncharacterized protein n=1 Tax=Larimichthys crocea TaxID=215358 RepID=A0A6G0HRR8_LARCR|nr:hypothetical protein D5F01_LYC20712 [Larimichthys crocea]